MGDSLLERERQSRRAGSGVAADDLIGSWRLEQVWPRHGSAPSDLNSALLRSLGAQLRFARPMAAGAETAPSDPSTLQLENSVRLGALGLQFSGPARLEGRRPLLVFRFERLALSIGSWRLLDRPLPHKLSFQEQRAAELPFFALIDISPAGDELSARGRGGGLALWRRPQGRMGSGSGGSWRG